MKRQASPGKENYRASHQNPGGAAGVLHSCDSSNWRGMRRVYGGMYDLDVRLGPTLGPTLGASMMDVR